MVMPLTGDATVRVVPGPVTPISDLVNPSTATRIASGTGSPFGVLRGCFRLASISSCPSVARLMMNVQAGWTSRKGAPQISSLPPLRRSVQQVKYWPLKPVKAAGVDEPAKAFVTRDRYGQYLQSLLRKAAADGGSAGRLTLEHDEVLGLSRESDH